MEIHAILYHLVHEHIDVLLSVYDKSRTYAMIIHVPSIYIKSPLYYLHNNFTELLVYHTEIFEAFFPL
jgi:hypothetical protein